MATLKSLLDYLQNADKSEPTNLERFFSSYDKDQSPLQSAFKSDGNKENMPQFGRLQTPASPTVLPEGAQPTPIPKLDMSSFSRPMYSWSKRMEEEPASLQTFFARAKSEGLKSATQAENAKQMMESSGLFPGGAPDGVPDTKTALQLIKQAQDKKDKEDKLNFQKDKAEKDRDERARRDKAKNPWNGLLPSTGTVTGGGISSTKTATDVLNKFGL